MPRHGTKRKFDSGTSFGFAEMFEHLEEAVFLVRVADRCILGCNQAAEELFGYDHDDLAGQQTSLLHFDEEHHESFGRMSEKAIASDGVYSGNFIMRRKDGSLFSSCHRIVLVHSSAGEVMALSFVTPLAKSINVGETNTLRSLLGAQLSDNTSYQDVMHTLLRITCNAFDWDYGEVWSMGHHGQLKIDLQYPKNDESLEEFVRTSRIIRFPPGDGMVGRVYQTGEPESHDQGAWSPGKIFRRTLIARRAGLVAFYGAPIIVDQKVVAVILLARRTKKDIAPAFKTAMLDTLSWIGSDPRFTEILSSVSDQVGSPSHLSKRQANALYNGALPSVVYDANSFEIIDFNERTTLLTKYAAGDLFGRPLQDVFELDALSFDVIHEHPFQHNGLSLICDDKKGDDSPLTGGCMLTHPIIWNGETVIAGFYMNNLIVEQIDEIDAATDLIKSAETIVGLTRREREVFSLLLALRSSKAVANILEISHRTVEVHRASIIRHFGVESFSNLERRLVRLFFDTE